MVAVIAAPNNADVDSNKISCQAAEPRSSIEVGRTQGATSVLQEAPRGPLTSHRARSSLCLAPWQPAIQVADQYEEMPAPLCYRLELPEGSSFADGARTLMAPIITQTSQPWPDEFPRKIERRED